MKNRFQAPGDFAQAYVIAHEVGHHVQNLLGIAEKVQSTMRRASKTQANRLSVRMELQADCYAGVWGYYADRSRGLLETGTWKRRWVPPAPSAMTGSCDGPAARSSRTPSRTEHRLKG